MAVSINQDVYLDRNKLSGSCWLGIEIVPPSDPRVSSPDRVYTSTPLQRLRAVSGSLAAGVASNRVKSLQARAGSHPYAQLQSH